MRASSPVSIPRLLGALVLFSAGALILPGCGAAAASKADAPPPSAPSATGAPDDVESAQSELDRGEWRITELFGPPGGVRPAPPADEPAASASPAASAAPTLAPTQAPKVAEMSGGDAAKPDACAVACSALASMGRAARHMCEMAGPDEPRCTSARERVQNATDRVAAHCTCGL